MAGTVLFVFALAAAGVFIGTRLAEVPRIAPKVLAFSGALLILISSLWLIPEAAAHTGWAVTVLWAVAGFLLLGAIDRFVYPICPACSHTHNHEACATRLHGFAAPLLVAIGLHSFLDGWGLATSQEASEFVRLAFLLGIALHKLPEGLALGAIVRASMASHWKSVAACLIAEAMTVVGGGVAIAVTTRVGAAFMLLALAAGVFIYLGYHALEAEFHRRVARNHVH